MDLKKNIQNWQSGCTRFFYFFVFSMMVTVFRYLVFTFLPGLLGEELAATEFMWPQKELHIFGADFTWSLLGYNVLYDASGAVLIGGGLGYFISYEVGSFLAQCINFPLQRNITFKSHGNPDSRTAGCGVRKREPTICQKHCTGKKTGNRQKR